MSDISNPAHRREARIALAMLPVGVVLLVVSVLAAVAVAARGVVALATGWSWALLLWCLAAMVVAVWNARAGIEMMSAFDWRPLPLTLLLSIAIVAAWPDWWL